MSCDLNSLAPTRVVATLDIMGNPIQDMCGHDCEGLSLSCGLPEICFSAVTVDTI